MCWSVLVRAGLGFDSVEMKKTAEKAVFALLYSFFVGNHIFAP